GQYPDGINYVEYGANVSAYAGKTETLSFSAFSNHNNSPDNIQFSSQPIPDPSALSLLFAAGGVLASFRARHRAGPVNSMGPGCSWL
ncbi:MAG: hypothetical protein KGJ60_15130, partial [Verrucomicrobiota bacterium]|nr:hypothetical protein [Verrucomicrobiota bacterium]